MAISLTDINVGAAPNDDTGDPLRTAFQSVNSNNTALETAVNALQGQHWTIQNSSTAGALGDRLMANNHAGITITMPATFVNSATSYSDLWVCNADDASNVTLTPASGDAFFVDGATHGIDTSYALTAGNLAILSPRTTDSEWDLVLVGGGAGGGFTSIIDDETYGNYAIGLRALDSLTSGSGLKNVAIGEDAGTTETTGDENTFIGHNAGKTQNGRSKTTYIGAFAGAGTGGTGGFNNVAVGHGAMQSINNGPSNTAVGTDALKNVNAGGSNCAFGYQSGDACSGSNNAFFGTASGGAVNTGSNNTLIGASAGSTLTTGSGCVILGAYLTQPASGTADYQIRIGSGFSGVPVIDGFMGANTDVDHSGNTLTVSGSSAFPTATTNLNAGDLILQGGKAATTGAGVGGDVYVRGGAGGSAGTAGLVIMDNLPTSDPTVAGALWNNSGVLSISAG